MAQKIQLFSDYIKCEAGDIADPYMKDNDIYMDILNQIEGCCEHLVDRWEFWSKTTIIQKGWHAFKKWIKE